MAPQASMTGRAAVETQFALAEARLARLRELDPILLDVSLREPCSSAETGHTLENKLALLRLVDEFGFRDRIIATFNYQLPEHPQVEDDFCRHLNEAGYDLTGAFALSGVGALRDGAFVPDISMRKLVEYRIPNTMHELCLLPLAMPVAQLLDTLSASIAWLRRRVTGDHGGPCRIYLNLIDLLDVFFADRELVCQVLGRLAQEDVDGVSFEDGRGTYFPFQVGAMVTAMKALLRPHQKVLFHAHAGNGMENACALEALLQGADGYWAGMDKQASTIGHASLGELIANLVRAGNQNMAERYRVQRLVPTCHEMHRINAGAAPPADWPMLGSHAYRQMLGSFAQTAGRPMDLAPGAIGAVCTHRIAPVGSDAGVVQARVGEALGIAIDAAAATRMILLMRADLRQGLRIRYDDPHQMQALLERARAQSEFPVG